MNDENKPDDKDLEKTLTAKIQAFYNQRDYGAALAQIDEYISKIGINKQIYLLREKIQELKKNMPAARPQKKDGFRVVSALDEMSPSDSSEFKPAEIEAAITATLQKQKATSPAPAASKAPTPAADDDVMELGEDMAIGHKMKSEPAPMATKKENKSDTRPFDFQGYLNDHTPQEVPPPATPIPESRIPPATAPSQPPAKKPPLKVEQPAIVNSAPPPRVKNPPPAPPADEMERVPPADQDFVIQLESELSKNRKKPTFTPSFMKSDPQRGDIPPEPPRTVYTAPAAPPRPAAISDDEEEPPQLRPNIQNGTGDDKKKKLLTTLGIGALGLAVIIVILATSGIFGGKKSSSSSLADRTASEAVPRPRRERVKPKAQMPTTAAVVTPAGQEAKTPTATLAQKSPAASPQTPESEFEKNLAEAQKLYDAGKYLQAKEAVALAGKIKNDLRLTALAAKIEEKLQDIQNNSSTIQQQNELESDERDFTNAKKQDSPEAYQEYLKVHPMGNHMGDSVKRIKELEKAAQINAERQLVEKAKSSRQAELRTQPMFLSKEKVVEFIGKVKSTGSGAEERTINSNRIIIDYTTGLMWYRMERPSDMSRADLWASRRYANYGNWRLPTCDEAQSLLTLLPHFLPANEQLQIWTADRLEKYRAAAWTLKYPPAEPILADENQLMTFFFVRTIR